MSQERVRYLRKRIGWTQKQMAKAIGIADQDTISHWETGFRIPKGISERMLLLLEKLRGTELRRVTKRLEKIGLEKTKGNKLENINVKGQTKTAQASFSETQCSVHPNLSNEGGKR